MTSRTATPRPATAVDPSLATTSDGPAAATPVLLDLRGGTREVVRRAVEGHLGWQLVDDDPASLVPPRLRLVDVGTRATSPVPTVLLIQPDDPPIEVARAAVRLRPDGVLAWPADADALVIAATTAMATRPASSDLARTVLRVGGAGGGVGTTTVAAALAGIAGWTGRASLLVAGPDLTLPPTTPTVVPDALTAIDLWQRAAPVPGVGTLRAVRVTSPAHGARPTDHRVELAVLDDGVADDVDILVCRPDGRGLAALHRTTAGAVVVVGTGPVTRTELAAALGPRPRVELPWSARVARAGVAGRLPGSLPGSYLRRLLPLVPAPARPD